MSEEKIIDNGEINDDVLEGVSGGDYAIFLCNGCKKELKFWHAHYPSLDRNGEITCPDCKITYRVEPNKWRVAQKDTDKGVAGLRWECSHGR